MSLYEISTKYEGLVNETLEAVGNWWFDQIVIDGGCRFGDPHYQDMENSIKMIQGIFGVKNKPRKPDESLRPIFVNNIVKEPKAQNRDYGGPSHVQSQIGFDLDIEYGINKEMTDFWNALTSIGVDPEKDPLPYKTSTCFIPGYAYEINGEVIYRNKTGLLGIISEINQGIVEWDETNLSIKTNVRFNHVMKLRNVDKFITCKEIYDHLVR